MRLPNRKLLDRLAIAACALVYATVVVVSLSSPPAVVQPPAREIPVGILPRDDRLLPDTAASPEPEPLVIPEPIEDLLAHLDRLKPPEIEPPKPSPHPRVELPPPTPPITVHVPPVIPPPQIDVAPPPPTARADILAAPPLPRATADARQVLRWVAPDEELWVIARGEAPPGPIDTKGTGEILATVPTEGRQAPVPLKRTETFVGISSYIATVTVKQRFRNPYDARIEAIYRFPLPHDASLCDFIMTIGDRRIRGIIRERMEAERIFQEAKRQGLRGVLLAQEGPSLFSHRIANVEPEEDIDVEIKYFHTLRYTDGWYEFAYPMVVRPHVTQRPGEEAEPRDAPEERSGRDIELSVAIDAGVPIEDIVSPSHRITVRKRNDHQARVQLRTARTIPNQDFVLRYRVAGDALRSAMLFHRSKLGGFFTFMLHPPADLQALPRQPIELVFALDCSESMQGNPFTKARLAVERALRKLTPDDAFQVVRFADKVLTLGPAPVPATPANVDAALSALNDMEARGATLLNEGVQAALTVPPAKDRLRFVVVITDGYVADEEAVLADVEHKVGDARVFSVGIGKAPNAYLLERMAQLGRGAVAYIGPSDDPIVVTDRFLERATRPALTDISIDWGTLRVADVYPQRVPDVFYGRPVILTGRFRDRSETTVRIRGRVGGQPREYRLRVDPDDGGTVHAAIPPMWAKARIADLARQMAAEGTPALTQEITRTALHFNLVTPLTRFIAIDTLQRPKRQHSATLLTPDLVPQALDLRPTGYRP